MRKRFLALLVSGWLMLGSMAWAESPIFVNHTLTGYTMGTGSAVMNFSLTVKNPGNSSITNLILSYVPLMIISRDPITLNIGTLDPQAEVQVPFTITTPMLLDHMKFSGQPLFWIGSCTDDNGNQIQFPVNSVPGGAL